MGGSWNPHADTWRTCWLHFLNFFCQQREVLTITVSCSCFPWTQVSTTCLKNTLEAYTRSFNQFLSHQLMRVTACTSRLEEKLNNTLWLQKVLIVLVVVLVMLNLLCLHLLGTAQRPSWCATAPHQLFLRIPDTQFQRGRVWTSWLAVIWCFPALSTSCYHGESAGLTLGHVSCCGVKLNEERFCFSDTVRFNDVTSIPWCFFVVLFLGFFVFAF